MDDVASGPVLPVFEAKLPGKLLFPFSKRSLDPIAGGIIQAQRVGRILCILEIEQGLQNMVAVDALLTVFPEKHLPELTRITDFE
jgi:hypothetical protein